MRKRKQNPIVLKPANKSLYSLYRWIGGMEFIIPSLKKLILLIDNRKEAEVLNNPALFQYVKVLGKIDREIENLKKYDEYQTTMFMSMLLCEVVSDNILPSNELDELEALPQNERALLFHYIQKQIKLLQGLRNHLTIFVERMLRCPNMVFEAGKEKLLRDFYDKLAIIELAHKEHYLKYYESWI